VQFAPLILSVMLAGVAVFCAVLRLAERPLIVPAICKGTRRTVAEAINREPELPTGGMEKVDVPLVGGLNDDKTGVVMLAAAAVCGPPTPSSNMLVANAAVG
jgi:hypothetical protein